jgi:hypothetical protein
MDIDKTGNRFTVAVNGNNRMDKKAQSIAVAARTKTRSTHWKIKRSIS